MSESECLPRQVAVTVIVAARNEEVNIARCLASLAPAEKVYVIDSGSTDATAEVSRRHGADVVEFVYRGGYPKKRQWALETLPFKTDWILLVDADEQIPQRLWVEIAAAVTAPHKYDAHLIRKGFHFLGRKFRWGGFSFDAVLLIRRGKAHFESLLGDNVALDMEVHERVVVDGRIGKLRTPLIHDDFKTLEHYIARHNRYSTWEATMRQRFLTSGQWGDGAVKASLFGTVQERRRFLKFIAIRVPLEPLLWFVYHYVFRAGFLEGRRGLIASRIRSNYIAEVRAKMYEMRLGDRRAGVGTEKNRY